MVVVVDTVWNDFDIIGVAQVIVVFVRGSCLGVIADEGETGLAGMGKAANSLKDEVKVPVLEAETKKNAAVNGSNSLELGHHVGMGIDMVIVRLR